MIEIGKLVDYLTNSGDTEAVLPAPRGIGTAVSFDWGLGFEFLIFAGAFTLGAGPGAALAAAPPLARIAAGGGALLFSAAAFALGESMRRGRLLPWLAQILLNSAVTVAGVGALPSALGGLRQGHVGPVVVDAIMLFISPIALWLLTRRATRAWIGRVTSQAARQRHGGAWMLGPLLFGLIGGLAVAFAYAY